MRMHTFFVLYTSARASLEFLQEETWWELDRILLRFNFEEKRHDYDLEDYKLQ